MRPVHRRVAAWKRECNLPTVFEPAEPDLRRALAAVRRVFGQSAEVIALDDHQSFELHHVALPLPRVAAAAAQARAYYGGVLGLTETSTDTPSGTPVGRGGIWFRGGSLRLHLTVTDRFRPTRTAHPGIQVRDLAALAARLRGRGLAVQPDQDFPGYQRFLTADPFGNRLEFLQLP